MDRETYRQHLQPLQVELSRLQDWVRETGYRGIIVFEGRDAAGKGSTIRTLTRYLSPRVFQVHALPAPSDRQKTQLYLQRYIELFPAAGEIMIFDRSWYNRAGVEIVMGFCTPEDREHFFNIVPPFERALVAEGINLFKYWLEVGHEEQRKRIEDRIRSEKKTWKLSHIDLEARRRWYDYSRARDQMFATTDTEENPWYIVRADDKYTARLNLIHHLLQQIPYVDLDGEWVTLPERDLTNAYDDEVSISDRRFIDEKYS